MIHAKTIDYTSHIIFKHFNQLNLEHFYATLKIYPDSVKYMYKYVNSKVTYAYSISAKFS